MTPAASRKRRYRAGERVLRMRVDFVRWAEVLVDAGWFPEWDANDRCAVTRTTAAFIEATTPALIDVVPQFRAHP